MSASSKKSAPAATQNPDGKKEKLLFTPPKNSGANAATGKASAAPKRGAAKRASANKSNARSGKAAPSKKSNDKSVPPANTRGRSAAATGRGKKNALETESGTDGLESGGESGGGFDDCLRDEHDIFGSSNSSSRSDAGSSNTASRSTRAAAATAAGNRKMGKKNNAAPEQLLQGNVETDFLEKLRLKREQEVAGVEHKVTHVENSLRQVELRGYTINVITEGGLPSYEETEVVVRKRVETDPPVDPLVEHLEERHEIDPDCDAKLDAVYRLDGTECDEQCGPLQPPGARGEYDYMVTINVLPPGYRAEDACVDLLIPRK